MNQRFASGFKQCVSCVVMLMFVVSSIVAPVRPAFAQSVSNLPPVGTLFSLSPEFRPTVLSGMKIHPDNPLRLDFFIDQGEDGLSGEALQADVKKMVNYFLAALTVPENEMWVNLSPYEKDRIIANGLSRTQMGQDMLLQDYLLKQVAASLMYPEDELGKKFWEEVYAKVQKTHGDLNIPSETFNKVWIVPSRADIAVKNNHVFVVGSHLSVMLEEDYLAQEMNRGRTNHGLGNVGAEDLHVLSSEVKEVIRTVIIPAIEREVNEGKTFANLRQIYNSMILATWYKKHLKNSLLGQVYMDRNLIQGIATSQKDFVQQIYRRYVDAFSTGVYDMVKEEYDPNQEIMVARKYFSGGLTGVDSTTLHHVPVGEGELNRAQLVTTVDLGAAPRAKADLATLVPKKLWPIFFFMVFFFACQNKSPNEGLYGENLFTAPQYMEGTEKLDNHLKYPDRIPEYGRWRVLTQEFSPDPLEYIFHKGDKIVLSLESSNAYMIKLYAFKYPVTQAQRDNPSFSFSVTLNSGAAVFRSIYEIPVEELFSGAEEGDTISLGGWKVSLGAADGGNQTGNSEDAYVRFFSISISPSDSDDAMFSKGADTTTPVGGIDFNAEALEMNEEGLAAEFSLMPSFNDPAQLEKMQGIRGIVPQVGPIVPAANIRGLLGLSEGNDSKQDKISFCPFEKAIRQKKLV